MTAGLTANALAANKLITTDDTKFSLSFTEKFLSMTQSYENRAFAGTTNTTSTFSGWGGASGTPQNFNCMQFRVKNRAGNATNIKRIKVFLVTNNRNGTIIARDELKVDLAAGIASVVTWNLGYTIANSSATPLYFIYQADQINDRQFATTTGPADGMTFPKNTYCTSASTPLLSAMLEDVGNSNNTLWTAFGTANTYFSPTAQFISDVGATGGGGGGAGTALTTTYSNSSSGLAATNVQAAIDELAPKTDIYLTSQLYATEGTEFNIYFRNLVYSNLPFEDLGFDVVCTKGAQYADYWRYTPLSTDAGSTTFTINVYYKGALIAAKTATLLTTALSKSGTVKILCVGDSTTAPGTYIQIIKTDHPSDALAMTFIGTQGTTNKHEGYGGYKWSDFATVGRTLYRFDLTGVTTPPASGAIYTVSGNSYQIVETNVTAGTGYVKGLKQSGSGTPSSTGTITKSSGTGDATCSYNAYSVGSGNPFWNTGAAQLDFANYLSTNSLSLSAGDFVTFHLGINDIFGSATDAANATTVAQITTDMGTLIFSYSIGCFRSQDNYSALDTSVVFSGCDGRELRRGAEQIQILEKSDGALRRHARAVRHERQPGGKHICRADAPDLRHGEQHELGNRRR